MRRSWFADSVFDRQSVQKLSEKNNINQTDLYLAVDKFLLPLFSPRDEILSVSWEEFNVDDDMVFVALEGYLVCPEKLVGGPNWKRVEKIFSAPS